MEINSLSNQSVMPGVLPPVGSPGRDFSHATAVTPMAQQFAGNPVFTALLSMLDRVLSFAFSLVERLLSPRSAAGPAAGCGTSIWDSLKDIGSNLLSRAGDWLKDKFLGGAGVVGKVGSFFKGLF